MKAIVLFSLFLSVQHSVALQKNRNTLEDFPLDYKIWYLDALKRKIETEGNASVFKIEQEALEASMRRLRQLSQTHFASEIELLSLEERAESKRLDQQKNGKEREKAEIEIALVTTLSQRVTKEESNKETVKDYFNRLQSLDLDIEELDLQILENALAHAKVIVGKYEVLRNRKAVSEVDLAKMKLNMQILAIKVNTQRKKISYLRSQQ